MRNALVAVVVTHNQNIGEIDACLGALQEELQPADALVIVDNNSETKLVGAMRKQFAGIEMVTLTKNLGFPTASNRGAARYPHDDVLLINPDLVVRTGAVEKMRNALGADRGRGAVGPQIRRPDGTLDRACRRGFPRPTVAAARLLRLEKVVPNAGLVRAYNRLDGDSQLSGEMDSGTGAALLVRREAWDELRGFDEQFFMYGDDLDLCYRLHQKGWKVWYEAAALCIHVKGTSTRRHVPFYLYHFHRSMWVYYRKHYGKGYGIFLSPLVALALIVRCTGLIVVNLFSKNPAVSR